MNAALAIALAATLTFPAALDRAMRTRAVAAGHDEHARMLEALPVRTLPMVRAEAGVSTADNLNLLNERAGRIDAFLTLINVDYPLLTGGAEERRLQVLKADAQLLRQRSRDEAEDVFAQTLDAFADLYLAGRRIELLDTATRRAATLREKAGTMLEASQISNITAAQWQDQALATESQLVDLELHRLDAETRLKQLIGDPSPEPLHAALEIGDEEVEEVRADRIAEEDPSVVRASLLEQRRRLALQDAVAQQRPQLMLSAFGGLAAVPDTVRSDVEEGTFGIYGLRLTMSFPLFDASAARRLAEARIEADEAARMRDLAAAAARNRADLLLLETAASDRRIRLLSEAVDVARRREESSGRLVSAGVRPDADLVDATANVARRESDLLAARVERWKLQQRLKWIAGAKAPAPPASSPVGGH